MVQVVQRSPGLAQYLGEGLGKGIERGVQAGQLSEAFQNLKNLPQGSSLLDMIGTIGPQMLQTPGGAQLLGELAPLLQKQSIIEGYKAGQMGGGQLGGQQQLPQGQQLGQPGQQPLVNVREQPVAKGVAPAARVEEDLYGRSQIPPSQESTYPKQYTSQEPLQLMSPQDVAQRRRELTNAYLSSGALPDPQSIEQQLVQEQQQRALNIQQQQKEREIRKSEQQDMTQQALDRFKGAGLGEGPEDFTVFEKFHNDAIMSGARDPNQAYQLARTNYRKYESARDGLRREIDLSNPLSNALKKLNGTYKDADTIIKDIQPQIKVLKDLGLINETRDLLSGQLGLGPEQTETALFYPSKDQLSLYNTVAPNKNYPKYKPNAIRRPPEFPGSESRLKEGEFDPFKGKVRDILRADRDANLMVLRRSLNQDKHYAWQDINRAILELIDEGEFVPNNYQFDQLNILKQPPLPGFAKQFEYFWKGRK